MNGSEVYRDIIEIYREASLSCDCKLDKLLEMVNNKGAVLTAKELIRKENNELSKLISYGRDDLTIEALILKDKYSSLFNDEDKEISKERLNRFRRYANEER